MDATTTNSHDPDAALESKSRHVVSNERSLELLKKMMLVRRFEEACAEHYSAGSIRGFMHLCIGEEAVAAGVIDCMLPDDAIVATYREHAHAILKGIDAGKVMAEMFGKAEGCSKGRGGSMHLFDAPRRFFGGNAIVAGGLPLACGLALADKMLRRQRVTVCFFGEGAIAEGEYHESMNLAALWNLPVLFVCENNMYAMGTHIKRSESQQDLINKAVSYKIEAASVDGMDLMAVWDSADAALQKVRQPAYGPYFLECKTYRFCAHSMFDAELYRDKHEVEDWKKRDPINLLVKRLKSSGSLNDKRFADLKEEVEREIKNAVAFAEAGTLEPVSDLTRHVLWEGEPL
jgi:pyruvate dehydrogenase E1 component alpha subunit